MIKRHRGRTFTGIAYICLLLMVGCSSEDPQISGEKLAPLTLTENLQITADQESALVVDFSGLAIDSDGTIYVADRQLQLIHVFSSGGEYLDSIGEEGHGPGEFVTLDSHLRILSDTLYVRDRSAGRITFFDLETHQLAGSFNLPNSSIDDRPMGRSRDMFPMPGGEVLVSFVNPYYEAPREGEKPHMVTLSLLDKTGKFAEKSLIQFPVLFPIDQTLPLLSSGGINVVSGLSFYPDTRMAVDPEGNLFIGNSDSLKIRQYNEQGKEIATLKSTPSMTALTSTHLDSLADARESPGFRSLLDDVISLAGRPSHWPVFDYFLVDDAGGCWVKLLEPGKPEQTWWVFNEEGQLTWSFTMSSEVDLYQIQDDQAYGIRRTSGDLATVVRYRIDRS